jgi:ABC-type transporter Mla maintaining outer membrane lipid asymmetry ATPase subunit MlaF
VGDWLVQHTPELNIQLAGSTIPCQPGLQFGSRYVVSPLEGQVFDYLPVEMLERVRNLETFAGILAMDSQVLVLDEPFANLDYSGTLQVLSRIVDLHRAGKTIILSTHDLEKPMGHASRLILMKNGSILRDGIFENVILDVECVGVKMPCNCRMEALYG